MRDISLVKFGMLTAIKATDERSKSKEIIWLCECECGKTVKVIASKLRSGRKTSCGCKTNARDLSGKRYGKLVVIGDTGKRTSAGNRILLCRNENGIITEHSTSTLGSGKATGWTGSKEHSEKLRGDVIETTRIRSLEKKVGKNSSTGIKGVIYDKKHNTWRTSLTFKGKKIINKRFKTKEEAVKARQEAEEKYIQPFLEDYYKTKTEKDDFK